MTIYKILKRAKEIWFSEYQYSIMELIHYLFSGQKFERVAKNGSEKIMDTYRKQG